MGGGGGGLSPSPYTLLRLWDSPPTSFQMFQRWNI